MDLGAIQKALTDAGINGWLFYDFHHRDLMAYRILGLDPAEMTSRRWFYFIPDRGEPIKLAHKIESHKLDRLPGKSGYYLAWGELHEALRSMVGGAGKVAMQYSPMNDIPYVSMVDAGTVELVRSFGVDVVSSADLVQEFETVGDESSYSSHRDAGERVQSIKDEAFAMLGKALGDGTAIKELDVAEFIRSRFEQEGLTNDDEGPIVAFNDHAADPHFAPTSQNTHLLKPQDKILIDLWARRADPPGLYYDVTWCGFAGDDPPQKYREIFGVVCQARDAALNFVKAKFSAGDECGGFEVDRVCREVVEKAGYGAAFTHRTGHSIGIAVHGTGANIDNLETRDTRKLVPGTCFSIEPGIYLAGDMGVRTEIDVYLRLDGQVEVCGPIQQELLLL